MQSGGYPLVRCKKQITTHLIQTARVCSLSAVVDWKAAAEDGTWGCVIIYNIYYIIINVL